MQPDAHERAIRARKGSPFLNTAQAAFYVGLKPKTLKKMRLRGDGPRYRKHGRNVLYHIDDLDHWSEGRASAANSNDNGPEQLELDIAPKQQPNHGIRASKPRSNS